MVAERALILLLRCGAGLLLLAFFTIFLPVDWMARSHESLGLGRFPASPLVDYLTRSISALYAWHGGLVLVVSLDVRRYAPIVRYIGFTNLLLGVLFLGIDLHAGLPLWWILSEGPPVFGLGVVILLLLRQIERSSPEAGF